jgi:hypothetical protein
MEVSPGHGQWRTSSSRIQSEYVHTLESLERRHLTSLERIFTRLTGWSNLFVPRGRMKISRRWPLAGPGTRQV